MCRESFDKVGKLIGEWVDCHSGLLVIESEKVERLLRRFLGETVKESAIKHWVMPLRSRGLMRVPYTENGEIVAIYRAEKFPSGPEGVKIRKDQIDPDARLVLNLSKGSHLLVSV